MRIAPAARFKRVWRSLTEGGGIGPAGLRFDDVATEWQRAGRPDDIADFIIGSLDRLPPGPPMQQIFRSDPQGQTSASTLSSPTFRSRSIPASVRPTKPRPVR